MIQKLKRPFVWLSRFRHRRGYGVHSPFAFDLITTVFYEQSVYYAYACLPNKKVGRLLFRLVNRVQPATIVDFGHSTEWKAYLQLAKPSATYLHIKADQDQYQIALSKPIDFLFIHTERDPDRVASIFEACVEYLTPTSVCVIEGIHANGRMKHIWQQILQYHKVGVSFDLYDVGVLYFDHNLFKQHYIVNF